MQLDILNTITKYPSIPTYHLLDQGKLTTEHLAVPDGEPLLLTEKVDGTNARLILGGLRDFIVGSRQELLHACGDLVSNPALGIVETSLSTCRRAVENADAIYALLKANRARDLVVLYCEVYGGRVTSASREYCGGTATGLRLFDVAVVADHPTLTHGRSAADLASLRDGGELYRWATEAQLAECARAADVMLTPRVAEVPGLPTSLEGGKALLAEYAATACALDSEARGRSEGLVARTATRSFIAKLRVEDYRRALR